MRKFAIFASFFSAAVFLCMYVLPSGFLLLWPLLAAAVGVLCLLLRRRSRLFLAGSLACLGLCCGLLWTGIWDTCILSRAAHLVPGPCSAEALVLEYPQKSIYGYSVEVRMDLIRARLYYDEEYSLEPGQRIAFSAEFEFTRDRVNSDYILSQGVQLYAYQDGEIRVLGPGKCPWRFLPLKLARHIVENMPQVFGEAAAPFLSALLTDNRSLLREEVHLYAMLRESGIAHCVAVSGMHLSFLVLFLYVLLGKSRLSALVCIPVIFCFMAMTGFPASVVRAGVMQLAICLSKLTRQEYDSLTALTLALLILLLLNPYAAMSAGLQLSFASTLGILLFSDPIRKSLLSPFSMEKLPKPAKRFLGAAASSLAVSLSALLLSLPVTAAIFSRISLIAPVTNLLTLWAVALAFGFGLCASLLGLFWLPGAQILAIPARLAAAYIAAAAKFLGSLPFAGTSVDSVYIGSWLVLAYLMLPLFRWLPGIPHRMRSYFCAVLFSLPCFLGFHAIAGNQGDLCCSVLDVGQGQCLTVTGKDCSIVIDCGGSLGDNAGDIAANHLFSLARTRVDALILSHYHDDHADGALELMRRIPVGCLYAPPPETEEAATFLEEVRALGVEIITVSDTVTQADFGALHLQLIPPLSARGDNEAGLMVLGTMDEFDFLLTGDADSETELRLLERVALPDLELFIAGHHGSASSNSQRLLARTAPDTVVISAGNNSYGLPADAALQRLHASGADIYRTDENGTVYVRYQRGNPNG